MKTYKLPPEFDMLAQVVDGQSPQVRGLFHYALVMLIKDGKVVPLFSIGGLLQCAAKSAAL